MKFACADDIMTYKCLDCDKDLSDDEVTRCSLDAYADLSVDYDLICAYCHNANVVDLVVGEQK